MWEPFAHRAYKMLRDADLGSDLSCVEFGVYQGYGLLLMERYAKEYGITADLFGFDTFEGMPETHQPLGGELDIDWAPGTFSDRSLDLVSLRVPEATLVKGLFSDLMPIENYGVDTVAFAHLDCDLYEGYRDALRLLIPHLVPGSILLLDEGGVHDGEGYENMRYHGATALREWLARTETKFDVLDTYKATILGVIRA
jgi:hypothetical protein